MEKKNYYELLQVDKNASDEIIEKTYKLLVKKYHPDIQDGRNSEECQEKLKEITDAYSVLSDEDKRKEYNDTLSVSYISIEEYQKVVLENRILADKLEQFKDLHNSQIENLHSFYTQPKTAYPRQEIDTQNSNTQKTGILSFLLSITHTNLFKNIFAFLLTALIIYIILYIFPVHLVIFELFSF